VWVMTAFGVLALILAGIGVYSVVAYSVAQRTREYGIRLALGQDPRALRGMVLTQGVRLGLPAVLLGVGAALAAAPLLRRRPLRGGARPPPELPRGGARRLPGALPAAVGAPPRARPAPSPRPRGP